MKSHNTNNSNQRVRFNVLDILRIIGGLLFLNSVMSWYVTGTSTWSYEGKLLNPRYLKFAAVGSYVNLTDSQLSLYDGTDESLPIYIALNGSIYDVTAGRHIYGKGGAYHFFSGKDACRAFVTGCIHKKEELTYDLRGIDEDEAINELRKWQKYFQSKNSYWFVGTVVHEPVTGEPLPYCRGQRFPY